MNKKLKLVLLDDDPDFISYASQTIKLVPDLRLKKATTDPVDALVYLLKKRVDILLLDIDMPRLDGFQLMKQLRHLIRSSDPSVSPLLVVLCSGFENSPENCFKHHASYYIQKPLTIEKLIEAKIVIQENIRRLSVKQNRHKDEKTASEGKEDVKEAFTGRNLITVQEAQGRSGGGLSEDDLVTIKVAESILGVKRGKIKKMRDEGELTDFGKDGRVRLSRKEVEDAKVWYSIPKGKV